MFRTAKSSVAASVEVIEAEACVNRLLLVTSGLIDEASILEGGLGGITCPILGTDDCVILGVVSNTGAKVVINTVEAVSITVAIGASEDTAVLKLTVGEKLGENDGWSEALGCKDGI
jgi:hypothetical protein